MLQHLHGGFLSEYERDLILEIRSGTVKKRWLVDNTPGKEARRCASAESTRIHLIGLIRLSPVFSRYQPERNPEALNWVRRKLNF
jgi:hypothetical protein